MIVSTSRLREAIRRVSTVASPRQKDSSTGVVQAYSSLWIEFDEKDLILTCISGEQVFTERIKSTPDSNNGEAFFQACVPPTVLLALIKNHTGAFLGLSRGEDEENLVVKLDDRQKHELKSDDGAIQYFETYNNGQQENGLTILFNAIDLSEALRYCVHATGDRFDFVILKAINGKLWMAGTDGYRAAFIADLAGGREVSDFEVIITTASVRNIIAAIPSDEVDVVLDIGNDRLWVYFDNFSGSTLRTSGSADVFTILEQKPQSNDVVVEADLPIFMKAIGFLALMALDGNNRMKLSVQKENFDMSVVADQTGDSVWTMPMKKDDREIEELNVSMNPSFINQYLKNVKPTELRMCLSKNHGYPVYLENENKNQIFLFMPLG